MAGYKARQAKEGTVSYIVPFPVILADLTAFRTASLNGSEIGLWINNDLIPDGNTVEGDLTEPGAEWGGYARQTVTTWGPIYSGPAGYECTVLAEIAGPTSGAGDDVYGWLLSDGTDLIACGLFEPGPLNGHVIGGAIVFTLTARGVLGGTYVLIPG